MEDQTGWVHTPTHAQEGNNLTNTTAIEAPKLGIDAGAYFIYNNDVCKAWEENTYGMTINAFAMYHWLNFGQLEDRRYFSADEELLLASPGVQQYYADYPDVVKAYANNSYGYSPIKFAVLHFENYGKAEGRVLEGL
jgi:hypothetical protein